MSSQARRKWLLVVAVVVIVAAIAYVLFRPTGNVITSEAEARASCQVALQSHLRDVKKENEKWQIATVRFDASSDRWFCTLAGDQEKKLFIILKPKTGGFEVSASDR